MTRAIRYQSLSASSSPMTSSHHLEEADGQALRADEDVALVADVDGTLLRGSLEAVEVLADLPLGVVEQRNEAPGASLAARIRDL